MRIAELLSTADSMRGTRKKQPSIATDILIAFHNSARKAYEQAQLDPKLQADRSLNAGVIEGDLRFQVELSVLPNDELLGSRYLARDTDKTQVDEVDIFMDNGRLEATSGRLLTPDSRYLNDYNLTAERLQVVTQFVLEATDAGLFRAVPDVSVLPLPQ